jgi:hypothetical protein
VHEVVHRDRADDVLADEFFPAVALELRRLVCRVWLVTSILLAVSAATTCLPDTSAKVSGMRWCLSTSPTRFLLEHEVLQERGWRILIMRKDGKEVSRLAEDWEKLLKSDPLVACILEKSGE